MKVLTAKCGRHGRDRWTVRRGVRAPVAVRPPPGRVGFSLTEGLVVTLVVSLLVLTLVNVLTESLGGFTRQEESIFCAGQASLLLAQLKRDFELLTERGSHPDRFTQARAAVDFDPGAGVLAFRLLRAGGVEPIIYNFDVSNRSVIRRQGSREMVIGRGRVSGFRFYWQLLGADGLVRSFPADPENPDGNPPAPTDGQVRRCWGRLEVTLESPPSHAGRAIKQVYGFRVFPVRFNNELRSIWRPD